MIFCACLSSLSLPLCSSGAACTWCCRHEGHHRLLCALFYSLCSIPFFQLDQAKTSVRYCAWLRFLYVVIKSCLLMVLPLVVLRMLSVLSILIVILFLLMSIMMFVITVIVLGL